MRRVAPEHQTPCLKPLLDDRQLALVGHEIKDLPRLGVFRGRVLRDFSFEFFLSLSDHALIIGEI